MSSLILITCVYPERAASVAGNQVKIEWFRSAADAKVGQWSLSIPIQVGG